MAFIRLEHKNISEVLAGMNHDRLLENKCFFGGGTAIVLKLDEYRLSLDIDFLCDQTDGYREIRNALVSDGLHVLFPKTVTAAREMKVDQYGIRMFLLYKDQPVKFEIVREARVTVEGAVDDELHVPTLTVSDMFTQKLLANADRCYDRAVAYRDAIDLGCLTMAYGNIPDYALAKAEAAYGPDIERKTVGIVNHLLQDHELRSAASALQMDEKRARDAIEAVRNECRRIWPAAGVLREPSE